MYGHVPSQIAGLRKRLATIWVVAFAFFFSRVGPHVLIQAAGVRERLATILLVALKRLLLCMGQHVDSKVSGQ